MMEWSDICLRLGTATLVGGAIGLDRELHNKAAGLRTLAMVSLISAAVTLGALDAAGAEATTRVVQGLLTGVGFLGAGVIVRGNSGKKVHGLTTAAAIWCVTGLGILSAFGLYRLILITAAILLALLILGRVLERLLHGTLAGEATSQENERSRLG